MTIDQASNVFLVDVDDTLLDDHRIRSDLKDHLERACGALCRERYFAILVRLRNSLGYCDYLGALQRYRIEYPHDSSVLSIPSFLLDYPFTKRLYPGALELLQRFRAWGCVAVLSDGDAVFQPRKIERSGIRDAVDGHVLVYIHKEDAVDDIEAQYPARHYVILDHSLRTLAAFRQVWGGRVSTVLVRNRVSVKDQTAFPSYSTPDVAVEEIGELLHFDFTPLLAGGQVEAVG